MKRYRQMIAAAALLLAALSLTAAAAHRQQTELAQKLIRLHVVANSDSPADQQRKLQVRDAVLAQTEQVLCGAEDAAEALYEALPQLQQTAQHRLRQLGCPQAVQVSLTYEGYPTRAYDTFTLPAGVYPSLQVVIGAGQGQNWWCVVFPSICMGAVSELETAAASAGFTEQEIRMITCPQEYEFRFKLLELLQQLRDRLT